jgi:BTB/POZ domain
VLDLQRTRLLKMTSQTDELCAKAMLLQQEAVRAGHKLAVSEDGHCSILPASEAGKRKADMADLDNCEPNRARVLVDNPELADRMLHVNGTFYHAHSQLLMKRSAFLETLLGPSCTADAVIKLDLPGTDKHAFKVLLEYLYTGQIPGRTLMAQYSVQLAKNARFLNADELYDACVSYLVTNWRDVQKLNADTFATDMTMLLMQDVLKGMHTSTLKDRVLFMAASYSANSEEWSQVVKQQVTSDQFTKELTHSLLVELHSAVTSKQVTSDLTQVLDLIPSAVTVAAAQHELQAVQRKLQAELTKKQCTRCCRHVTQQQASYDRDGCTVYKHTGTLKQTPVRS